MSPQKPDLSMGGGSLAQAHLLQNSRLLSPDRAFGAASQGVHQGGLEGSGLHAEVARLRSELDAQQTYSQKLAAEVEPLTLDRVSPHSAQLMVLRTDVSGIQRGASPAVQNSVMGLSPAPSYGVFALMLQLLSEAAGASPGLGTLGQPSPAVPMMVALPHSSCPNSPCISG